MQRIRALDGLRGLAALVVFLCHLIDGLLYAHSGFHSWMWSPNAQFCIYVFFVISGVALSSRFFEQERLDRPFMLLMSRYLRLSFLTLLGGSGAYVLMKLGWMYNTQVAEVTDAGRIWGRSYVFEPSLWGLIRGAFIDVYYTRMPYNAMLWTMSIELYGSALLYAMLYFMPRLHPLSVYAVAVAFLLWLPGYWRDYLICFVYGIALMHARHHWRWDQKRLAAWAACVLAVAAIIFINTSAWAKTEYVRPVLAACVVWACLLPSPLARMCESRLMQFLGGISISLYITHYYIITSFGALIYMQMKLMDYSTAASCWVTLVLTVYVACGLAYILTPLERRTQTAAMRIARWLVQFRHQRVDWKGFS